MAGDVHVCGAASRPWWSQGGQSRFGKSNSLVLDRWPQNCNANTRVKTTEACIAQNDQQMAELTSQHRHSPIQCRHIKAMALGSLLSPYMYNGAVLPAQRLVFLFCAVQRFTQPYHKAQTCQTAPKRPNLPILQFSNIYRPGLTPAYDWALKE